jgi:hypothetical protein
MSASGHERRINSPDGMSGCPPIASGLAHRKIDLVGQREALLPLSHARAIDVTFNRELPMGHPEVLAGLIPRRMLLFHRQTTKGSWTCTGSGISFCW